VAVIEAPSVVASLTCLKAVVAARDREELLSDEPFSVRQA